MKAKLLLLVLCVLFVAGGLMFWQVPAQAEGEDDIVVITNKAFPAGALTMGQVKHIFQKKMIDFKGKKVVPIHAKKNTKARQIFNQTVLGMSLSDEQSYWQAEMVRSGVRPPLEFGNTLRAVFSVTSSVSYCLKQDFNPAVAKKVVAFRRLYYNVHHAFHAPFATEMKHTRF